MRRQLRDVILADRPVGYWPLGERSGTVARDLSGYGRNGTYEGTLALGVPGLQGAAPDFAGGSVNLGNNDAWAINTTGKLSLEFYVYLDVDNPSRACGVGTGGEFEYQMTFETGFVQFATFNAAGTLFTNAVSPTGAYTIGRWYQFVGTCDWGVRQIVYLDGRARGSDTSFAYTYTNGAQVLRIAQRSEGNSPWHGKIAHAAVYNHVLSPAQILRHYHAAFRSGIFVQSDQPGGGIPVGSGSSQRLLLGVG